jgi:hypothetical protein
VDWLAAFLLNGFDDARNEWCRPVFRGVEVCNAWVFHALCGALLLVLVFHEFPLVSVWSRVVRWHRSWESKRSSCLSSVGQLRSSFVLLLFQWTAVLPRGCSLVGESEGGRRLFRCSS